MTADTKSIGKPERIITLAMYLAERESPATKQDISTNVDGYQKLAFGDSASTKMFERDLESLKEVGIYITADGDSRYSLDTKKSFANEILLSPLEVMRLRLASISPLTDPTFIFNDELRSAVTKLSYIVGKAELGDLPDLRISEDFNSAERDYVKKLEVFRLKRKEVCFDYVDRNDRKTRRTVRPYTQFSIIDDWYLVCLDVDIQEVREFRISRMSKLTQRRSSTGPDFDPVEITPNDYIGFPFQFGDEEEFDIAFLLPRQTKLDSKHPWFNANLLELEGYPDKLVMTTTARSTRQAARWALEYATGIVPLFPQKVVDAYLQGLEKVEAYHG
ncbi:MAG: WYL domain-containing protein [Actinobacteria bacterium]|nr:WYL domain-containing protein [Actinomycetota bacterium]